MKRRIWIVAFLSLLGALGALPAQTPVEARRAEALERLRAGDAAEAHALFSNLASAREAGAFQRQEAAFYAACLQLSADLANAGIGPWQAMPEEPWAGRLRELEQAATNLRARAPSAGPWLRAHEFLGDLQTSFSWPGREPSLGAYAAIFDHWANSTDIEEARREYLRLTGRLAEDRDLRFEIRRHLLPYVEHAAALSRSTEEIQRFQWLLASFLDQFDNGPTQQLRRGAALRQALSAGLETPTVHYARALFDYGQWAATYGLFSYGDSGELRFRPDYAVAAESYRLLLALPGELTVPRQLELSRRHLEWMEREELQIAIDANFRPDAKVHFRVEWRNLEAPVVSIHRVPAESVAEGFFNDYAALALPPESLVEEQVLTAAAEDAHYPVRERVRLEADLPAGAYVVEARTDSIARRDVVFVSDLAVVTHVVGGDIVVYAADPVSGHPVAEADVFFVELDRGDDSLASRRLETNANGLAEIASPRRQQGAEQLVLVAHPGRGAALARHTVLPERAEEPASLMIYGVPEREVFRPGETARARFWARWKGDGTWDRVEPGTALEYIIAGPRQEVVASGTAVADDLGGFSIEFELPVGGTQGLHHAAFAVDNDQGRVEAAVPHLFRLQTLRSPELDVTMDLLPYYGGARLLGDTIRGSVQVSYRAGGEAENPSVELVVRRRPFSPEALFPADDASGAARPEIPFEEVQRLTLQGDTRGIAGFEIATLDDGRSNWMYELEARVDDVSRQASIARRRVVLAQQSYFAQLQLARRLLSPGETADLRVRLLTPEGAPVSDRGTLRVTRERWREIYIHRRRGDEIDAETFRQLPERSLLVSAQSDYNLKERGFVTEEVAVRELYADAEGVTRFTFEASDPGYYNFSWVSRGQRGQPIMADGAAWVTDREVTEIGYRPGGVELITERGPHRPGQPVPILVTTPSPDRAVLVSFAGDTITDSFLLRMEGTSQLIQFTPEHEHQPNAFVVATMVADEAVSTSTAELTLPPVQQFLDVAIVPDADGYEPRDTARFELRVRDAEGQPVAAEVVLSVADTATDQFLPRMRPGVRHAFYGAARANRLKVGGSIQWRNFFRPLEEESVASALPAPPTALVSRGRSPDPFGGSAHTALAFDPANLRTPRSTGAPSEPPEFVEMRASGITRRDFRSTAYWNPRIQTDEEGRAAVEFPFPDNLTEWRAVAIAMTPGTRVGEGAVRTVTRQPLISRLRAPRYLVQGDQVELVADVRNNSEQEALVAVRLSAEGAIAIRGVTNQKVEVPPHSTRYLTWLADAVAPGTVEVLLEAESAQGTDSVGRVLPVAEAAEIRPHVICGRTGSNTVEIEFDIDDAAGGVELAASTSVAAGMTRALPALFDFPYQTVEQAVSGFVPALAVRRVVRDLGFPPQVVDAMIMNGLPVDRQKDLEDFSTMLEASTRQSVARLAEWQRSDGSWPWLAGGSADAYMTAYVVHMLTYAEELGVVPGRIRLGDARAWLERTLTEEHLSPPMRAWMLHALASRHRAAGLGRPSRLEARALLRLIEEREALGPMPLALTALTARYFGFEEDAALFLRQLTPAGRAEDVTMPGVVDDRGRPVTVSRIHWGRTDDYPHWSEGATETTALVLEALLALRPDDPVVDRAVLWLMNDRCGAGWQNSRTTALVTMALSAYLQMHGARSEEVHWAVTLNGYPFEAPDGRDASGSLHLRLSAEDLQPGRNRLTVSRSGASQATYFSVQLPTNLPTAANSGSGPLIVTRNFEHLAPVPTLLNGVRELVRPLTPDAATIRNGERVEVVIRLDAARELQHVLVEDFRPAGFEPVQALDGAVLSLRRMRSGAQESAPTEVPAVLQLRGQRTALLVDRLPPGTWEARLRLRAEVAGDFHAPAVRARCLYMPAISSESAPFRLKVQPAE